MSKNRRKAKGRNRRQPRGSRSWLYFVLAIAVTLVIGLGAVLATSGGSPGGSPPSPTRTTLPDWLARSPALVKEAYAYAAQNPESLGYIPCYCGCGEHDGHRSAHDCFIAARSGSNLVYDPHGAGCDMCVDIALMTKKILAGGGSLREARLAVEKKYSSLGPPTKTPPLP